MKLTREDKINIYNERKEGEPWSRLSQKYSVHIRAIRYYVHLIDKHGIEIIYKKRNKVYSKKFKLDCINRVLLSGESSNSVSSEVGLPNNGLLSNWIRSYKENGYNIIERKRGRPSMKSPNKKVSKVEGTEIEKLKRKKKK